MSISSCTAVSRSHLSLQSSVSNSSQAVCLKPEKLQSLRSDGELNQKTNSSLFVPPPQSERYCTIRKSPVYGKSLPLKFNLFGREFSFKFIPPVFPTLSEHQAGVLALTSTGCFSEVPAQLIKLGSPNEACYDLADRIYDECTSAWDIENAQLINQSLDLNDSFKDYGIAYDVYSNDIVSGRLSVLAYYWRSDVTGREQTLVVFYDNTEKNYRLGVVNVESFGDEPKKFLSKIERRLNLNPAELFEGVSTSSLAKSVAVSTLYFDGKESIYLTFSFDRRFRLTKLPNQILILSFDKETVELLSSLPIPYESVEGVCMPVSLKTSPGKILTPNITSGKL